MLRTSDNDADKSAALQDHLTLLEQCQTESHRRGTGATMLIASVVELGLQAVVLAGIVWVVSGTLRF